MIFSYSSSLIFPIQIYPSYIFFKLYPTQYPFFNLVLILYWNVGPTKMVSYCC